MCYVLEAKEKDHIILYNLLFFTIFISSLTKPYLTMGLISSWLISQKFSSVTKSCQTLCDPMDCSLPGFLVHYQLPEFAQTHVRQVSDAIQPSHPRLSLSPPAFNLSKHQSIFHWVGSSHQVAKLFELQLSPSNEYSGLIFFRIAWFDLLAIQGTLKSLLQYHSSKAFTLLYGLTLTFIHNCWKNHTFDCMDLCLQNNVSAF